MAKHAQNISVRDPQSQALLKSIGVKRDVPVIGDPAFSLEVERSNYSDKPKSVGVTAVPYSNCMSRFRKGAILKRLLKKAHKIAKQLKTAAI